MKCDGTRKHGISQFMPNRLPTLTAFWCELLTSMWFGGEFQNRVLTERTGDWGQGWSNQSGGTVVSIKGPENHDTSPHSHRTLKHPDPQRINTSTTITMIKVSGTTEWASRSSGCGWCDTKVGTGVLRLPDIMNKVAGKIVSLTGLLGQNCLQGFSFSGAQVPGNSVQF